MIYLFNEIQNIDHNFIYSVLDLLPRERQDKFNKYKYFIDKKLSVISYLLLYYGLINEGLTPKDRLSFYYNKDGKPYLEDFESIFFNSTHCELGVACAISDQEVGIDIQGITKYNPKVAKIICNISELSMFQTSTDLDIIFTKIWVLKESYIKAIGKGLATSLKDISFDIKGNTIKSNKPKWKFHLIESGKTHISVCNKSEYLKELKLVTFQDLKLMINTQKRVN